jgi:hypothetical protein
MTKPGNANDMFDAFVASALDILRLASGEKNKVLKRLKKLERALVRSLSDTDLTTAQKSDVNKIVNTANEAISTHYEEIASLPDLAGISLYVAEDTQDILKIFFGKDTIGIPRPAYFKSVASDVLIQGSPAADWWKGQEVATQFKFAQQLRLGMTAGETNQQIVSRIVGKSGQPGVMDIVRRDAQSLVQTSVQTVANDARRSTFQENDDLIKGIRQVSTLDGHTSDICMAYSGAEWDMQYKPINGNTLPFKGGTPRHFKCRSLEVPITKTFKELGLDIPESPVGTRASDEGQIAGNTSFDAFLKRKDKAYLDDKLGPGRAELFRSGKITLRDLVNGDGNPVSLEQLRDIARKR